MANIKTYEAPQTNLTESTRGSAAWSQAGRRLGPLANEAAQFTRQAGALAADNKAELWPFDIMELYQRKADAAAGRPSGGGGGSPRGRAPGTGRAPSGRESPTDPNSQISNGSGALGRAMGGGGGGGQGGKPREPGENYTIDQGDIVPMSVDRRFFREYQDATGKAVGEWTDEAIKTQDYWTRYQGSDTRQTNQSGTAWAVDQYGNPTSNSGAEQPPPIPSTSGYWNSFYQGATGVVSNIAAGMSSGSGSSDSNYEVY